MALCQGQFQFHNFGSFQFNMCSTLTHVYTSTHTRESVTRQTFFLLMTRLRPSFERNKTEKRQTKALLYEKFRFHWMWWEWKSLPNVCIDLSSRFVHDRALSHSLAVCVVISHILRFHFPSIVIVAVWSIDLLIPSLVNSQFFLPFKELFFINIFQLKFIKKVMLNHSLWPSTSSFFDEKFKKKIAMSECVSSHRPLKFNYFNLNGKLISYLWRILISQGTLREICVWIF